MLASGGLALADGGKDLATQRRIGSGLDHRPGRRQVLGMRHPAYSGPSVRDGAIKGGKDRLGRGGVMDYEQQRECIAAWLSRLAQHQFKKSPESKTWFLGRPGQGSANAYSITWSYPGTLTLTGDMGELVLTHYSAMPNWWSAVSWVLGNTDHDYFLRKSNAKQEYDPERTLQVLVDHLSEVATDTDAGGYERANYLFEGPQRRTLGSFDMNEVFALTLREEFVAEMRFRLETGESEAVQLCQDLGMDDYYGSQCWPTRRVIQMACLFRWAEMVAETGECKEIVERERCRAELLYLVRMHDRRMPS